MPVARAYRYGRRWELKLDHQFLDQLSVEFSETIQTLKTKQLN